MSSSPATISGSLVRATKAEFTKVCACVHGSLERELPALVAAVAVPT